MEYRSSSDSEISQKPSKLICAFDESIVLICDVAAVVILVLQLRVETGSLTEEDKGASVSVELE